MSALSNLYVGFLENPSWTQYEEHESLIFESNYLIPILWFALFNEENLSYFIDPEEESDKPDENSIPFLVGRKNECISSLDERTYFILKMFSGCKLYIEKLRNRLIDTDGNYVSVDFTETFQILPDNFIFDLKQIFALFDDKSPENVEKLLGLACVEDYNLGQKDFIPDKKYGYEYHVIGYVD